MDNLSCVGVPLYFVLRYAYFDNYDIPLEDCYYSDLCANYPLTTSIYFAKRYKSLAGCKRAISYASLKSWLNFFDFDRFVIVPVFD